MARLLAESFLLLLELEWRMTFYELRSLHRRVHTAGVNVVESPSLRSAEEICRAVDLACIFYPKRVFCLQRSAAATILLRHSGIRAEMVLGAQLQPFRFHAWVELEGVVLNDRPYVRDIYQTLERC